MVRIGSRALAGPWLAASLLSWLIAATLARRSERFQAWAASSTQPVLWTAIALVVLLLPFAAWRAGAISPYYLGLSELNWLLTLGRGSLIAALVAGTVMAGWLLYRREMQPLPTAPSVAWLPLLQSALLQWHLAFYRAAAIELLPTGSASESFYWGSWLGLLLVAGEVAAFPEFARALRIQGKLESALRQIVLAVATTGLFVITRNFWACLTCHLAVEGAILLWFPAPVASAVD